MSDWADEKANLLWSKLRYNAEFDKPKMAAALRIARNEAMEDAARLAEQMLGSYTTMDNIPGAIRALKDKQP